MQVAFKKLRMSKARIKLINKKINKPFKTIFPPIYPVFRVGYVLQYLTIVSEKTRKCEHYKDKS